MRPCSNRATRRGFVLPALVALASACGQDPAAPASDAAASGADIGSDSPTSDTTATATGDDVPADTAPGDATTDATTCLTAADCSGPVGPCEVAACVAGACQALLHQGPCEDGAPCTVGDHCVQGACVAGPSVCACDGATACATLDPCLGQSFCNTNVFPHRCDVVAGSAPACAGDTGDPCTKEVCDPAKPGCSTVATAAAWLDCQPDGCSWRLAPPGMPPNSAAIACDDGDACTGADVCQGTTCQPGDDACACHSDSDCPDDGNLCNGKPYCNKAALPWACATNPATVVACSSAGDTACARSVCDPATGACALTPVEATAKTCSGPTCGWAPAPVDAKVPPIPCDDGNICTVGEVCKGGSCLASADTCKCSADADCDAQEDGDLCNGTLYCDKASGACKLNPATVVSCPSVDDSACAKNVCYPKSGLCAPAPVEFAAWICAGANCAWTLAKAGASNPQPVACDDGNPCSQGEACAKGACVGGTDTCACAKDADCLKLDDGDLCNGVPYCDKAKQTCIPNPKTVVSCPSVDDTTCRKSACEPKTGLCAPTAVGKTTQVCATIEGKPMCTLEVSTEAEAKGVVCQDGDACTVGDVCAAGVCQPGANTCACASDGDCAGQDDGNLCNGKMYCNKLKGTCAVNPATVISCKSVDDTACLKSACHPKTGQCLPTPTEATAVVCQGSACRVEVALAGPVTATAPCEDGKICTKGDQCAAGVCKPGVFVCECDDTAQCLAKDDGNLCNGVPYCDKTDPASPVCKPNPASAVVCPAASGQCSQHLCNPATGKCAETPANQGKSCDDGTLCTLNDACADGQCQGGAVSCDDGSLCTNDSCLPAKGCVHAGTNCDDGNACSVDVCDGKTGKCLHDASALDGKGCSDGDPCTVVDVCGGGACKSGAAPTCPAPSQACHVATCVAKDASSFQCVTLQASDGSPCGDGSTCTLDAQCAKGSCLPGKTDRFGIVSDPEHIATSLRWTAVAATAEGGAVVGGYAWSGNPTGASISSGKVWVGRLDAKGTVAFRTTFPTTFPLSLPAVNELAVRATDDGGALVAATEAAPPAAPSQPAKPMIAQLDAKGGVAWKKLYGDPKKVEALFGALLQPGGTSWLVGAEVSGSSALEVRVIAVAPNWQQVAMTKAPSLGIKVRLRGVAARKAGGIWAAGVRNDVAGGTNAEALVAAFDDDGSLAFSRVFSAIAGMGTTPVAVAARADGVLVLVGSADNAQGSFPWRALVRPDGTRWTQEVGAQSGRHLAVAAGKGDAFVLVGDHKPLGVDTTSSHAEGRDRWLNGTWTRDWPAITALYGAAPAAKAGWLLVGGEVVTGGPNAGAFPRLIRSDGWGRASCDAAGACALLATDACDDGDACTADVCQPGPGCSSQPVALLRCQPADGCSSVSVCKQGSCAPTSDGRLWHSAVHDNATLYATAPAADGGAWFTGTTTSSAGPLALVGRADVHGATVVQWTDPVKPASSKASLQYVYGHEVLPIAQGGALVAANARQNDVHIQGCTTCLERWRQLRRYDDGGKVMWEQAPTTDGYQESDDLVPLSDGTFAWLWRSADVAQATRLNSAGTTIFLVSAYTPPTMPSSPALEKLQFGLRGLGWSATRTVVTGWRVVAGVRRPWGSVLDDKGQKLLIQHEIVAPAAEGHEPLDLAAAPVGSAGCYLLLHRLAGGTRTPVLARLNASLVPTFTQDIADDASYQLWALRNVGDALVLAGAATLAGTTSQVLDRRALTGARVERALLPASGPLFGLAAFANGDLIVGGRAQGPSALQATLSRVNAFGHPSCAAAGACAGKLAADCDDGEACTLDLCDVAKGCVHKPGGC